MLELAELHFSPAIETNAAPQVGGATAHEAEFSCEPQRRKCLIIEDGATNINLVELSLRSISRFEPQITTAGSLAVARLALAADTFDLVVLITSEDLALDVLDVADTARTVVVVTPAPSPAVKRQAARKGLACISLVDASPRVLQNLMDA